MHFLYQFILIWVAFIKIDDINPIVYWILVVPILLITLLLIYSLAQFFVYFSNKENLENKLQLVKGVQAMIIYDIMFIVIVFLMQLCSEGNTMKDVLEFFYAFFPVMSLEILMQAYFRHVFISNHRQ